MSNYGLMHRVASYHVGKRNELLNALESLSDGDCDFNGENGLGYLKDKVWNANGYENEEQFNAACDAALESGIPEPDLKYGSNQDYYLNKVKDIEDEEEAINTYLSSWLDNDGYYDTWDVELVREKGLCIISIAALTYC